jgi:hypothetical protein
MTLITKPDMEFIWASGGAIVEPSDVKKQTGWTPEVPPHQWENWIQNRQDNYLAHINQRGIPEWDGNTTEYKAAGLSYVQGSNGVIYKSVAASGPASTTQDPTTDVTGTYWTIAFAPNTLATETVAGIAELSTQAEAETGTNDTTVMTPLKVKQAIDQFASSSLPLGYFSGFTLSNNAGAPNTTVDTDPGTARSSDNTVDITLTSTISGILQSSGAWAAGTSQNKLDTGAKAINSTYHEFVIGHPTLDDDVIYSLSATAPALPSGYAGFRRVGRIATDGSGNIRAFKDRGDGCFDWVTPVIEATVVSIAPGSANVTLTGMGGVPVRARLQGFISGDAAAIKFTATDVPSTATGAGVSNWTGGHVAQAGGGSGNETGASEFEVSTDTSGQVTVRYYSAAGNTGYRVINFGWQEIR